MVKGYLQKWKADMAGDCFEIADAMGVSKSSYQKRIRDPYSLRLKEVMKLWDEIAVSPDEMMAFWKEVRGEWEREH